MILINLNLNGHMYLVATIIDGAVLDDLDPRDTKIIIRIVALISPRPAKGATRLARGLLLRNE